MEYLSGEELVLHVELSKRGLRDVCQLRRNQETGDDWRGGHCGLGPDLEALVRLGNI